jgi:hypothetical protein
VSDPGAPPPAGWYADPGGSGGLRYWDGSSWTQHVTAPAAPRPVAAPTAPARYDYGPSPMATGVPATVAPVPAGRKVWPWFVGIGVLFLAGVLAAIAIATPKVVRAGGRVTDLAAQSSANRAVAAGEQVFALDGSFTGATADRLEDIEPAVTFKAGPSPDFTTASFHADDAQFTVAVLSLTGRCYVASIGAEVGGPRRTGRLPDDSPCWAQYAAEQELIAVEGF